MTHLYIAIGNPLRGDDAVAHRTLRLLLPSPRITPREVIQLTPELSAELTSAGTVIFLDADQAATAPWIEPINDSATQTTLAHAITPAEIVCLARRLYNFAGEAFLCHIPAFDFEIHETLSPRAEEAARAAAEMLQR